MRPSNAEQNLKASAEPNFAGLNDEYSLSRRAISSAIQICTAMLALQLPAPSP